MPKDPIRNVDRYKIRGGHLNEFDYSRQQTELSREQGDQPEQSGKIPIPSEQAKANRIKQLLQKYGESVPGEPKKEEQPKKAPKVEPARKMKTVEKPPEKARAARKATGQTKKSEAKPVKKATAKTAKAAKRSTAKAAAKPAAKAASKKAAGKSPARGKASKTARGASAGKLKSESKGKKARAR
jgi:hypothetical protein